MPPLVSIVTSGQGSPLDQPKSAQVEEEVLLTSKAAEKHRGREVFESPLPFFAAAVALAVKEAHKDAQSSPLEGSEEVKNGVPSSPASDIRVSLKLANWEEEEEEEGGGGGVEEKNKRRW